MATVPLVSGGIGHVPAGGVLGMAMGAGMRAAAGGGAAAAHDPQADAAMAQMLGLPGAPPAMDEHDPRLQAHKDLITATSGLPAAQRAQLQLQILADPAAWGAEGPGRKP